MKYDERLTEAEIADLEDLRREIEAQVPVEDPVAHEIAAGRTPKPRVKCRPV
jgi:hypothetical protein